MILGYEVKPRTAYDVIIASNFDGGNISIAFSKIIHDSIKQSYNWKLWRRYSPSKILKSLTEKELINGAKEVLMSEGKEEDDLVWHNYLLGTVSHEDFTKWLNANKKKVMSVQTIMKP